jgi:hypothetical protein
LRQRLVNAVWLTHDAAAAKGPSYIPSRTFALALIDVIREPHTIATSLRFHIDQLIADGSRNPVACTAEVRKTLDAIASDPALNTPAIVELRNRIFAAVDDEAFEAIKRRVQSVMNGVPAAEAHALAPLTEWLRAAKPEDYTNLRAGLADAIRAIAPAGDATSAARQQLDALLNQLTLGSPEEVLKDLQRFVSRSSDLRNALDRANDSLGQLAGSLGPLLDEAAGDVEHFRVNVERWFNDGMDRVGGSYKRHTAAWQTAIGLLLAIGLNIDVLMITRTLWRDPALRQTLVLQAQTLANESSPASAPPDAEARFTALRADLDSLGLPIGWRACDDPSATSATPASSTANLATPLIWCNRDAWGLLGIFPMLLGWALTAAAVSLGAPFWFDILKRFVSVRAAGKAPEERPLKPKEVPQPREPGEREASR